MKQSGNTQNVRYYFSEGFEKDITGGTTRYIQYISGPAGLVAIIETQNGDHTVHYTYTDHLGSILAVTNSSGNIEAEQSFDAWGRRRNVTSWELLAPTATTGLPVWLYRGYTGHEHLDQFGLINMNGRLYDPVLGRMLSPDNFVQEPGMTQSYNRYSYAMNNPLVYTDPDGNFWNIAIGAAVGGLSYTLGVAFSKGGFDNWNWFGFTSSVIVGAMTSGFASELGGALGTATTLSSAIGKGAIQAGAYAAWGGTMSVMTGGDFVSGAIGGAAGSVVGSFMGPLTSGMNNFWSGASTIGAAAVAGGVGAELSGGDFWRGAATSGLVAGFNHVGHNIYEKIARTAEKYLGRKDWAYANEKDNFGLETNKCNKFVYDVLYEAGIDTGKIPYGVMGGRPRTAGEWADPTVDIKI